MLITPIRFVGNLAKRKNKLMLLFLQSRRSWMQESKGWGIRSKLVLYAVTARWAGVGVAPSTDAQLVDLRLALASSRVLYFFCRHGSLRESLTAPAQLCGCDQEPDLLIWASCVGFPKDVNVDLLITPLIPSSGRGYVAIMGSHVRELKISKWPWDLQDRASFAVLGVLRREQLTAARWGRQYRHPNVSTRIWGSSVFPLNYYTLGLKDQQVTFWITITNCF